MTLDKDKKREDYMEDLIRSGYTMLKARGIFVDKIRIRCKRAYLNVDFILIKF